MAKKTRTKTVNISISPRTFSYIFKKFKGSKPDYDFSDISDLRQVLSNEKSRLLSAVKYEKPDSIYKLAKVLKRDFKSVSEDVRVLERFGFIELVKEEKGRRKRLKPVLLVDSLHVEFDI
jgi:predicted transcriptional regulator